MQNLVPAEKLSSIKCVGEFLLVCWENRSHCFLWGRTPKRNNINQTTSDHQRGPGSLLLDDPLGRGATIELTFIEVHRLGMLEVTHWG